MAQLLMWRERAETGVSPSTIQRRLDSGDDVEGLDDLPIREMIDKLRQEFPGVKESAGTLQWKSGEERFQATWTWQHLRFDTEALNDEHREKIFDIARQYHCPVYDPLMNLRMGSES